MEAPTRSRSRWSRTQQLSNYNRADGPLRMILAGDIGGTKTLLGLFEADAVRPAPRAMNEFRTLDYAGLPAMIDEFITTQGRMPTIERAAFGVAGPVIDQVAE